MATGSVKRGLVPEIISYLDVLQSIQKGQKPKHIQIRTSWPTYFTTDLDVHKPLSCGRRSLQVNENMGKYIRPDHVERTQTLLKPLGDPMEWKKFEDWRDEIYSSSMTCSRSVPWFIQIIFFLSMRSHSYYKQPPHMAVHHPYAEKVENW